MKRRVKTKAAALRRTRLSFPRVLTGEDAQAAADALEDLCVSVFIENRDATDGDDWAVTLITRGQPAAKEVVRRMTAAGLKGAKLRSSPVPRKDWLRHVHENFPPLKAGRFFIRGSHFRGATPERLVPLHIDAATAFGSGEHATTRGCLRAFDFLAKKHAFKNALDMGCGSGILGVAMRKTWRECRVTAIDIDPEAVRVTQRHAKRNRASLQVQAGDGFDAPLARKNAPYDLVAANILAGPLIAMAPQCAKALAPQGFLVLSGLLRRQQAEVLAAYENQGLSLVRVIPDGDWATLVLRRAG